MTNPTKVAAERIAKIHEKEMVVVFHFDKDTFGYASYGQNRILCDKAKQFAEKVFAMVERGKL